MGYYENIKRILRNYGLVISVNGGRPSFGERRVAYIDWQSLLTLQGIYRKTVTGKLKSSYKSPPIFLR